MNNYPTGNVRINKLLYFITYAKGFNVWKCLVYKFKRSILSILSRMLPPWESKVLFGEVIKPLRNKTLLEKALPRSCFKVLQPFPTSSSLSLSAPYVGMNCDLCFPQCPLDSHSGSHAFPAMEDFISSGTSSSDKPLHL